MRVDVYYTAEDMFRDLCADVRNGLTSHPKHLPPKWFYDETGSKLFDEITRLDEYYPTRCERSILELRAADIASLAGAGVLIELGSGTSAKTRILLDAMRPDKFVAFDVSEPTLRVACEAIAAERRGMRVHGVVGDFERHLGYLPGGGRRLIAFLGGTIGNLAPAARRAFLKSLSETMRSGDSLLLGTDLVKDPARLVRAYDDAEGVTAEFNRNVLRVLNRELQGCFDPADFDHVAVWDPDAEWIEMRLEARSRQRIRVALLDLEVCFEPGEQMRTEISAKFRRDRVAGELAAHGLNMRHWWTDPGGDFALSLATRE